VSEIKGVNMSPTKNIISKALQLKPAEKSILIEALLKSLDVPDPKIEKIWAAEAEKRLKAYKAGKIKTVSFEEMFIGK
jgi:putative addiction module component (TIGR02574 family)